MTTERLIAIRAVLVRVLVIVSLANSMLYLFG